MFTTEKTTSTEIKTVTKLMRADGELLLKCPHCQSIRGVEDEGNEVHGAQYQDNLCDGWYEISFEPIMVRKIENL